MKKEISKLGSPIKDLNKSDFNKIKEELTHKWKKYEYIKILPDLQLVL